MKRMNGKRGLAITRNEGIFFYHIRGALSISGKKKSEFASPRPGIGGESGGLACPGNNSGPFRREAAPSPAGLPQPGRRKAAAAPT